MQTAFVTGCTGQDGSYLIEQLLEQGCEVHGLIRRSSTFNTARIDHVFQHPRLHLWYGDLTDTAGLINLLRKHQPDEVYHLAAQSHVRASFDIPSATFLQTGFGTLNLLEAVRMLDKQPLVYNACSSEMFGGMPGTDPQNERTPFYPRSPYAVAKVASYWLAVNYREAYGIRVSNGILFNHESPRRGETFVTRKIARAAARIASGLQETVELGNLDAKRDWGYAPEYTQAMQDMVRSGAPDDFVIATGETHTVREFVEEAFDLVGIANWQDHVEINPRLYRPTEVNVLCGDSSKARAIFGWNPKIRFKELARILVGAELEFIGHQLHIGHKPSV